MAHAAKFLALVNDAKKRVKETNVADVKRRMDEGEKFVLVDVREESEWAQGHLPGAIHLGKGIIERDVEERAPDTGAKVILYCGGGFRSALAADNLQKMGYTNVESMDGGWKGWIGAGLPLKKGEPEDRLLNAKKETAAWGAIADALYWVNPVPAWRRQKRLGTKKAATNWRTISSHVDGPQPLGRRGFSGRVLWAPSRRCVTARCFC